MALGTGYGWVLGGAIPGTTQPATARGTQLQTAERAPEAPARGWSGWSVAGWTRVPGPPFGPGRSTPVALPVRVPACSRLLANKARFDLILLKVSQNQQVSPKYV